MASPVYDALDKAWNSTCRVLFCAETAPLSECAEWLSELNPKLAHTVSSLTGNEITYSILDYSEGSKRASLEEVWKLEKPARLSINEIKDIDSIIEAVQDRVYYTGDVILGNSGFIERSSNCKDSYYVLESGVISDSKHVCNSARIKECEFVFGSDGIGASKFLVRGYEGYKLMRCLEAWKSQACSDCYYINGVMDSTDCMFCFNVRSKRHAIGNLELSKDKYFSIKKKLVSELAEGLSEERRLPSLIEIVGKSKSKSYEPMLAELKKLEKIEKPDLSKIESAFGRASGLIFGKKLLGIDSYAPWLKSHVLKMEVGKSIISGKPMLLSDYSNYLIYPKNRLVTRLEAEYIGNSVRLDEKEAEGLSLPNISGGISKVAYMSPEFFFGENVNCVECSTQYQSQNSYRSPGVSFSKNTAYSFWPREADCIFGSSMAFESYNCIHCYYSENLNRCFEVDSSKSCSDSYFLHNCENVRDSMFCFNAKNLTNAIGNAQMKPEEYKRIKSSLVSQMAEELERTKNLKWDIFSIGAVAKRR